MSRDGGRTWRKRLAGLDRRYCWAVAANPERPQTWYVSAAPSPGKAHGGGLPEPLGSMPYGLAAPRAGEVWAALADGAVWRSTDHGASWDRVPVALGTSNRAFALIPA